MRTGWIQRSTQIILISLKWSFENFPQFTFVRKILPRGVITIASKMCTPTTNTVYRLIVFLTETQFDHSYTTPLSSVFKSLKQFFRLNQTSLPSKGNTLALYNLGKCHVSMGSWLGEWTLDTAIKIKILKKEKKKPLTKVRSFLWHLLIQSWCFRCIAPPSTEALKRHGRVFSLRTCTRVQLLSSSFY